VPETKIGLVDTTAFGDEKVGITRYVNAVKSVGAAFQVRINELNTLQNSTQSDLRRDYKTQREPSRECQK